MNVNEDMRKFDQINDLVKFKPCNTDLQTV